MANAFQHAYWNALMVFRVNKSKARQFATAHESFTEVELNKESIGGLLVRDLTNMDLWNNYVGRKIGQLYKNAYKAKEKKVCIYGNYWTIDRKNPENQLADIVWPATVIDGYTFWLR